MSSTAPTTRTDPWLAHAVRIRARVEDYPGVCTYALELTDPVVRQTYRCRPGQFNMLYLPGVGESAISVSGHDTATGAWLHTVRTAGQVTGALARLRVGDGLALRGPFGSCWPMESLGGRDLVFAAGGIGLAPLRPAVEWALRHRPDFGRLTLLYGARSPSTLLYPRQLEAWRRAGLEVEVTVDRAEPGWQGAIGVVPLLLDRMPSLVPRQTSLLVCGPEVMMRYVARGAIARGVRAEDLWISLERNMQCAVGFCGHCQLGPAFVCQDGPVLRYDRLAPYLNIEDL